mgnify:CR=1 FL=1
MKKIGLLTINDFNNYGNRLQNYAIQYHLKKMGCEVITLKNDMFSNSKKYYFIKKLKHYKYEGTFDKNEKRKCKFIEFNKNINFSDKKITAYSKDDAYDYYITGSDQVWNPTIGRFKEVDLLSKQVQLMIIVGGRNSSNTRSD